MHVVINLKQLLIKILNLNYKINAMICLYICKKIEKLSMKNKCFMLLLFASFITQAQVGINTDDPTKNLDVNGSLRVRSINLVGASSTKDSVMVTDGKGNLKYVSSSKIMEQVPSGTFPMQVTDFFEGNGTTANPLKIASLSATENQVLGWTATGWKPITQTSSSNWSFDGNANTLLTNILGTNTDVVMNIRSNNTTMLSFGRRQTLGLFDANGTGLYPYNQPDNSVSYIRGSNGISAMQFESASSLKYKPLFFTTSSGNFGFRGSAGRSDWFEVASNGTSNDGSLGFTIGDDGNEPIVFRKFNKNTNSYVELMRMQGTGLNAQVRVGINMTGNLANSTFEVRGSYAKTVKAVTTNVTLGELDHTSILSASVTAVTLPTASLCTGRIYILKKTTAQTVSITGFRNRTNISTSNLPVGVTQLQSDGTNWQQIN